MANTPSLYHHKIQSHWARPHVLVVITVVAEDVVAPAVVAAAAALVVLGPLGVVRNETDGASPYAAVILVRDTLACLLARSVRPRSVGVVLSKARGGRERSASWGVCA